MQQKGVIFGCKLIKLGQKGHSHEAEVAEYLKQVVVVVKIVFHPLLLLAGIRAQGPNVLLPFHY